MSDTSPITDKLPVFAEISVFLEILDNLDYSKLAGAPQKHDGRVGFVQKPVKTGKLAGQSRKTGKFQTP